MSNMITVGQFNTYVHNIFLAEELLQNIQVYGEVSGLSFSGNNLYFSIKDEEGVLNCVKFGVRDGGFIPKEGDMVIVCGAPNYYIKGGRFTFNAHTILLYGQGVLYKRFLELKTKLEGLGMFDSATKMPIPQNIKRVGVISSETGAVIQDIIDITSRRNPMLDIVLFPAKVQGIGAEETIIEGLQVLDQTDVDVIIIARGGGSAEDLSTFNSEKLAFAIFNTQKPVISAVGHETDFTIADFVADLRAPTPSAAAELVAIDLAKVQLDFKRISQRLLNLTTKYYQVRADNLSGYYRLLNNAVTYILQQNCAKIREINLILNGQVDKNLQSITYKFDLLSSRLQNINPNKFFKMGYGQIADENGDIVNSIKQVEIGKKLDIKLIDGTCQCQVASKKEVKS